MGCDIHAYIDYDAWFSEKEEKWFVRNFSTIELDRNYSLFYVLANVRHDPNRMPPGLGREPKGLPDNLSWVTKDAAEQWVGDGHSYSWLTLEELKECYKNYLSIERAPSSWYQFSPPEGQPIPEDAIAKEVINEYLRTPEWYVEVGKREENTPIPQLEAVIASMEKLNGGNPNRSRLVFWFDN